MKFHPALDRIAKTRCDMHLMHTRHRLCLIALFLSLVGITPFAARGQDQPRWTTSRIQGSPEAPPPYRLQRIFPKLTFSHPLDVEFAPGSDRYFVAEQTPHIYSFPDDQNTSKADLFVDLSQLPGLQNIPNCKGIDTVYGFTFHPKFATNHYVYICYLLRLADGAERTKALRVSRFTVKMPADAAGAPQVDLASEQNLLQYWGAGHSSGCLKFGPDGMLYIGTGDGADPTPPDPFNTGQDISDLLSSILRIDVDHPSESLPYSIPKDNPFLNILKARGEVWAYGLRNPWRFTFDQTTGDLWAGDVGWETWEMVYRIERGGNYGWSITEGPGSVHPGTQRGPTPILPPTLYLSHSESCSVTGGFVYRGKKLPGLVGQYVFGDWETRRLFAAPLAGKGLGKHATIAETDQRIVSFGEDAHGELSVVDYEGGGLYAVAPQPPESASASFPRRLSETGLYSSIEKNTPAPGVLPFEISAPQWVDGASSERWIALPNDGKITADKDGKAVYPKDSVLTRTFFFENSPGHTETRRRIETQILHFTGKRWNGYSYRWNDAQTDATLVDAVGDEIQLKNADVASSTIGDGGTWHIPSRAQCATCHNTWAGATLAYNPAQLLPEYKAGKIAHLVDPQSETADLNSRARSYLHANCAHCHRFGGGGAANIDLSFNLDNAHTKTIDILPTQGNFGIDNARIIAPGDPSRSMIYYRMAKLGSGHMPHMGSYAADEKGMALIARWIAEMPFSSDDVRSDFHKRHVAVAAICQPQAQATSSDASVNAILSSTSATLDLCRELSTGNIPAPLRQQLVARGYASDRDEVRGLFARFIPPAQRIKTLGVSFKSSDILSLEGDVGRGKAIFSTFNDGLCKRCHQVAGEGIAFGPELTHVASKYGRVQLLENIITPSKEIAEGFTTYRVKTKQGDLQTGLIKSRTAAEIILETGPGATLHIPSSDIAAVTTDPASLMPDGLLSGLTPQQAADLLDYLQTLK
jgi:putative heme-binding domain-containing protein